MTTIRGPGGLAGPNAPGGPDGAPGVDDVGANDRIAGDAAVEQAHGAAGASEIDALAAEVAAGRLTPREAIDRLVDAAAGPELGAAERAELRELLTELVANDPYLGGLAGRI